MRKLWYGVLLALFVVGCKPGAQKPTEFKPDPNAAKVQFYIMAKCPFGARVMQAVVPVLQKMGTSVDFTLEYIGREEGGKLTSMHGDKEVEGDTLQLCAKKYGSHDQWLNFLTCVNKNFENIPDGWEACAQGAGLAADKLKACKEGPEGKALLKASFDASTQAKAFGSPTIVVNGERYAGGRSESSFARAFCAAFKGPQKPQNCASIPGPVKVPITIIIDKRCQGPECFNPRFVDFLKNMFEGADIKQLDYAEAEAQALWQKTEAKVLPLIIFGKEVEKETEGFERLKRRMEQKGDVYTLVMGNWDPKAEICDNGSDDDGNGKVDCADDGCKAKKVCRTETKNKIDLFVMAQCPFGVKTLDAMREVLENFGRDSKKINFSVNYIGDSEGGNLNSMHGPEEVNEDLREICAQKYYPKKFQFMDYVWCRDKNIRDTAWEGCAKEAKMDPAVLKKCAEGDEGKKLLSQSFELAKSLEVRGSPSWLLNNRFEMDGRSPETIKKAFCDKNAMPECSKTLSDKTDVPAGGC